MSVKFGGLEIRVHSLQVKDHRIEMAHASSVFAASIPPSSISIINAANLEGHHEIHERSQAK